MVGSSFFGDTARGSGRLRLDLGDEGKALPLEACRGLLPALEELPCWTPSQDSSSLVRGVLEVDPCAHNPLKGREISPVEFKCVKLKGGTGSLVLC